MSALPLTVWSLPLGAALDGCVGDPRGWPHPVRAIGWLVIRTERLLRWILAKLRGGARAERAAGIVLVLIVAGLTTLVAWAIVAAFDRLGSWPALIGRTLLVFWGLAAGSLGREAMRTAEAHDLDTARRELSWIVGRDTHALDQAEICRACVETVAENTSDAVVAPLFWFVIGGPIGLWFYKAVNTLDSMLGYRNARFERLGWASARLDDVCGLIPARLTWLLLALAAVVVRERGRSALLVGWRDGRKHPSPNSAWGEAAMAGALNVQLGGLSTYGGAAGIKPHLGEPGDELGPGTVRRAVRLMAVASALALLLAWAARSWLLGLT